MKSDGRVVLVTGAGKRVGAEIAETLGERGFSVAVHCHGSVDGAAATAEAIRAAGSEAEVFRRDLYVESEARALVRDVIARFGRLDAVVASAANFDNVRFEDVDAEAWTRALSLNTLAPFWIAQESAAELRRHRGSMVFITCTSATTPYKNYLPYTVSKAATKHLMRTLALELAPDVRVNAVAPGTVLPPEDFGADAVGALGRLVPLQRIGQASDVAGAVAYLLDAPFVTGQELRVDGGRTISAAGRGDQAG